MASDPQEVARSFNLSHVLASYCTLAFGIAAFVADKAWVTALSLAFSPTVFALFVAHFFVWKRKAT